MSGKPTFEELERRVWELVKADFDVSEHYLDPGARKKMLDSLTEHGAINNYEARFSGKNGAEIWIRFSVRAYRDKGYLEGIGYDITREKRAEEELSRVATEWQTTFDAANDALWVLDKDQRVLRSNKMAERLFQRASAEIIGRHCWEIAHGTRRPIPGCPILRAKESLRRETMELQIDKRWFEITVDPVLDADGHYAGAVHIVTDITERKRMEDALVESERKWRNVLVNTPQVGISLNPDGKIVFANAHFQKLTGWKEKEIIGRDWFDMFIPEDIREEIRDVFQTVMSQKDAAGFSTYENDIVKRNGEQRHIAWSNVLTKDARGEVLHVTCLGIDLAERKRAGELLAESESKYRSMMESLTDPTYICSPDFKVAYMNPAMIRRVGRDATGETCYSAIHGLDQRCEWCVFDTVAGCESIRTDIVSPKDGRHYRANNMPIHNEDGSVSKMTIYRDITDYLEAVSEKEKATAHLQQAQKLESIDNLAGGIAHDFNNLLSSIIGYTQLALEDAEKGTMLEDNLREVYTAGNRAADLVQRILAIARRSDEALKPSSPVPSSKRS